MRIGAADAEFIFLRPNAETIPALFHNKSIDSFMAFAYIGLRHYQMQGSCTSVSNPVLGSVEQIIIAFVNGSGVLRCCIRPSFRFRQTKCTDNFSFGKRYKVFLLLLF